MDTEPAPVLTFWDRNPPLSVFAAARLASVPITSTVDPKANKDTVPVLTFSTGETLSGVPQLLRFIARAGDQTSGLYGSSALAACQVDTWVDQSTSVVSGAGLEPLCLALNNYLCLRTFFVGYTLTLADIALWGQLQSATMWKKVKGGGQVPHLSRWFDFCAGQPQLVLALEDAATASGIKRREIIAGSFDQKKIENGTGSVQGNFDISLPGAQMGKVVTRFPPEPSGYLHVGHAKAALLNQFFAEMYKGKLLVRFDDTNPSKEKDEYVENIINDIADLGLRYDKLTHTSDYFPQLLDMAERLIKGGYMYADDTPQEQMRDERMKLIESGCRNRSVEENLKLWEEMKIGSEIGLLNCMRFKLDMKSLNGAMRDPVAYRCNLTPHWRTGKTYKVYPTYDCACPFVDSIEGVTHALRTSEYKDREEQFYWVLKVMQKLWPGLPHVHVWDYSRLNFINTVLSKRKLTWFVDSSRVSGWDDPRMPTVQGILRRGLKIEALREFILSQGASKNVTVQEWDKIWTINKKMIDPVCPRHTAVESTAKVPVTLINFGTQPEVIVVPKHKKFAGAGNKMQLRSSPILIDQADAQLLSEGEELTLMEWGNAYVRSITRDATTGLVSALSMELHLEGDFKKTKLKLTWLADSPELVDLTLVDFDYLIWKRKIEEEDDFKTLVNDVSRFERSALGDANLRSLQKGDVLQLERKGYFICDEPLTRPGKPIVLLSIPDGRERKPFPTSGNPKPVAV